MLPKEAINEFKKIYQRIYGMKLTDEEALKRANNLVSLYKAVYGNASFGRVENDKGKEPESNTTTK